MEKKKVFLLQDTKEQNDALRALFLSEKEFVVVGSCEDGEIALSLIKESQPDFILLDLVLKGCDGIYLLQQIKKMNLSIKPIILTAMCSEEIIARCFFEGAKYFMVKPVKFNALIERMLTLCDANFSSGSFSFRQSVKREGSLEEKISKIFINVGIPPHIKGYSFLREGVKMAVENPTIINNITKQLYPKIGEKYNTTASKVERAIRHAIEVAWNRGRIDSINNILGVRAYVGAEKPTNGEFIALVADKMLLEKL